MSLFSKIKKGLGIGTAKIELRVSDTLSKKAEEIKGSVVITAKSEQKVKSVKIRFEKVTEVEINDEKKDDIKLIVRTTLDQPFEMKENEEKVLNFTLPLEFNKSGPLVSASMKGVRIELGVSNPLEADPFSASSSLFSPIKFLVTATADLEGVVIDPTAVKRIQISN